MKISKYIIYTDSLNSYGLKDKVLLFSTRKGNSLLLDSSIIEKILTNDIKSLSDSEQNLLEKSLIIVPDNENELQCIVDENKRQTSKYDTLSLTIQPSAFCQFECHYCGQEHVADFLTDDMILLYLKRINFLYEKHKEEYKRLHITWYGGEPLTALSAIKKASKVFQNFCKERDLQYRAMMVTNGYNLTSSVFDELFNKCDVRSYQITLDGIAMSHDMRRVLKNTRDKTFDTIYRNILLLSNKTFLGIMNHRQCLFSGGFLFYFRFPSPPNQKGWQLLLFQAVFQ